MEKRLNNLETDKTYSQLIKAEARRIGFSACGISGAGILEEDSVFLKQWLKEGMHGSMSYMENHFNKRTNPKLLVNGTKSVISVLLNYFPGEKQKYSEAPVLAKYAYGEDYHYVMRDMLNSLLKYIRENFGLAGGRLFVDSAPVLERAWAAKAGLGWIGKNTNLISRELGSFVFIGELLVDLELEPDVPVQDLCGTCTICIDTCPTGAIVSPYVLDGSRCISYFTIENKGEIPEGLKENFKKRVFGCDICQDNCPWNWKKSRPHTIERLKPLPRLLEMSFSDWQKLTKDDFNKLFGKSALKRAKYEGLKRNIDFIGIENEWN